VRDAFVDSLLAKAAKDDRIWLLNADLGFSVLEPFEQRFPDRYINVGIAEQNMAGIAAGLALSGKKVFIYSIGNFPTFRCLEQLRNDVCYHDADVKVVSVGGGFAYGAQGYTHHAIEDLAVMRTLPGMTVIAPGDPAETRAAVDYFAEHDGPGYLRLGRAGEAMVHGTDISISKQSNLQLVKSGEKRVLVLSTGGILTECVAAGEQLKARGVDVTVMSMPKLKPIDEAAVLNKLQEYDSVVTVEEHSLLGGLRDTIAPMIAISQSKIQLRSLGVKDGCTKGVIGDQNYMRQHCGIDADSIMAAVAELVL
jgi:transketolase